MSIEPVQSAAQAALLNPFPVTDLWVLGVGIFSVFMAAFSGIFTRWGWLRLADAMILLRTCFWIAVGGLIISLVELIHYVPRPVGVHDWQAGAAFVLNLAVVSVILIWYVLKKKTSGVRKIIDEMKHPDDRYESLKKAYPDMLPLTVSLSLPVLFQRCFEAAQKMGWEIVQCDESKGMIEAIDQSFWFGYKDDLFIGVSAFDSGGQVNIHTLSREEIMDKAYNVKRVQRFFKSVEANS